MTKSEKLFQEAVRYIPGGVNSPVRAYGSVGMTPRFMQGATGPYIFDVDGNKYIDYICSWGPMILGHANREVLTRVIAACEYGLSFGTATEIEVDVARLICENIPHVEMVRMVNSGTEAVMSALRVARGFTNREKIVKFAGCYHGHSDAMLVSAGSGVMTAGVPDSLGVTKGATKDTLTAVYNNLESVQQLFASNPGEIAAVIVEPVAANMGVVLPKAGFLQGLRKICTKEGALLIFDEVITGFRLSFGGAAEYFDIKPDLVTYGKIIGGGMPVGAYGGRKDVMEMVSPVGGVYQAGTLSGNPIAMAAGLTQLQLLLDNKEKYKDLARLGSKLYGGMEELALQYELPCRVNHIGSLASLFFTDQDVVDYTSAKTADTAAFADYFKYMLNHGIHLASSQFEAMFLSCVHTDDIIEETLQIFEQYLQQKK
ncbi:MAG: glutamate-1-semialdehyde 2,1-aminomutase [Lachnospiraceae bacterium]|nr:glutamate-1-semialdehyde 2,1-aminomutase [Lachnospiraceae bacterium]